ncbi:MAG: SseB family protein [Oscillospiraceae bacterium]|jgi:hypothetical protein|nr:SseB family protein [Oscillospiraceae bacterium]
MSNASDFPDWDEALRKYRAASEPAAIEAFETRLRDARYLAAVNVTQTIVSVPTPEGSAPRAAAIHIERVVASLPGCGHCLTFFTSPDELEKMGKLSGHGYSEVSFQQLYDETFYAKDKIGAIINSGGLPLVLSRYDLNRLADTARAGQGIKARELVYHTQTADAWNPELELAFTDALSRRPEAREAYIISANVAWRDDEQELSFAIDFDGDGNELYPYLAEAVRPHTDGAKFRFEKLVHESLQKLRATAQPVYLRADIIETGGAVRRRSRLFEDWDSEVEKFRVNLHGSNVPAISAAFEAKMYVSDYHVPFDTRHKPMLINHSTLGAHLPIFTSRREMLKMFKPGVHVEAHPFQVVHAMLLRYERYNGVVVNIKGNYLTVTRERAGVISSWMSGMSLERSKYGLRRITAPQGVPSGLADDLENALTQYPSVQAVFYLAAQTDDTAWAPLAAVVCAGREDAALSAIMGAMRRNHGGGGKFLIAKADAALLRIANALTRPLYARGGASAAYSRTGGESPRVTSPYPMDEYRR